MTAEEAYQYASIKSYCCPICLQAADHATSHSAIMCFCFCERTPQRPDCGELHGVHTLWWRWGLFVLV